MVSSQRLQLAVHWSLALAMLPLDLFGKRHNILMMGTAFRMAPRRRCVSGPRRPPRLHHHSQNAHRSNAGPDCLSVSDVTKRAIAYLRSRGASEADVSVPHLLAHAMNLPWDDGFRQVRDLSIDRRVSPEEQHVFQKYLERRANNEPLQYILGQWDFLDCTLAIRAPLLCPRPETEELALMVVHDIRSSQAASPAGAKPFRILDVGCGTGAIGIALCALLPGAQVTAIDVEPMAVATSNENARRILGETQDRYRAILCSAADFPSSDERDFLAFDAVVSNPPYIPTSDMAGLDANVLDFESHTALCGGQDGLDVVRDIIAQLPRWCNPGAPCWMEVDPIHPRLLETWLETNSAGGHDQDVVFVSGHKDMFGLDRFVKLQVRSW